MERLIWYRLRAKRLDGWKFRRQVPLGPYIADFLCPEASLIVELDGGQHAEQRRYDESRTRWLNAHGFRVLRFWNNDAAQNLDAVLERILEELKPSP